MKKYEDDKNVQKSLETYQSILEKLKKESAEDFDYEEIKDKESLDLCFLMDSTGSMGSYINATKENILSIVETLKIECPKQTLRLGMVAYRDFTDVVFMEYFNFSSNYENFKGFVSKCVATGGGDFPE
jgi:hypothetical protein